jgi:hypothetical protein
VKFVEVPFGLVSRQNRVDAQQAANALREGMRIFDCRVHDGLIRATCTCRPFWCVCVGHLLSFQDAEPGRQTTNEEVLAAIAAVRKSIPQLPVLLSEDPRAGRIVGHPMRAFSSATV